MATIACHVLALIHIVHSKLLEVKKQTLRAADREIDEANEIVRESEFTLCAT